MADLPSIGLVVVNHNGREHLPSLLDSIAALEYPRHRVDTIVVDNASSDGSRSLLADRYPWIRVLPQESNLGFAEAVNVGAAATSGELLALCNNDMRLDPRWLTELVHLYEPARRWPCVAGLILDWHGERVDFAGGFVNLHGFAGQDRYGEPVADVLLQDGRELPFPCGGSMLVGRDLFLELGGFDESYFALLEDVDFGWRLSLAGHGTRLAAKAISFHRHGATTGRLPSPERQYLFERNALATVLKNADGVNLARLLAFALFLLVLREREPGRGGPGVRAVADVAERLDAVLEARARVQRLRTRSDREIFAGFGRPFVGVDGDPQYLEAAALLARVLGVTELASDDSPQGEPTEEVRQLLALWRDRYGVDRSAWWHVSRSVARSLPGPARRVLGRALRR